MPARQAMTMRADLENNTASAKDDFGNPVPPVWATLATVACIAYTKTRKEVIDGDKIVLVEDLRALFSLKADVKESYRIANIKDRLGVVLFAGPLSIDTIQRRRDHIETMLNRIES